MESSGLYTVESTLFARVKREDRNTLFRCQVNYVLMGVNKTTSSQTFNITVHCKTGLQKALGLRWEVLRGGPKAHTRPCIAPQINCSVSGVAIPIMCQASDFGSVLICSA